MLAPDFSSYTLALVHQGKIVHSSAQTGLNPLVECIALCRPTCNNCILHDRVIGLAAARLIVYSGMIVSVITRVASRPAVSHLKAHRIGIRTDDEVDHILTRDGKTVCPGELIALDVEEQDAFLDRISALTGGVTS